MFTDASRGLDEVVVSLDLVVEYMSFDISESLDSVCGVCFNMFKIDVEEGSFGI